MTPFARDGTFETDCLPFGNLLIMRASHGKRTTA